MLKEKNKWLTISVINLAIVAFLGFVLRSKILFSIPFLDFKNILHAHSHFAFGGWITLCLLTLMTYEILPAERSGRPVYKWLLTGILINAVGMLLSFPFQGYAFFSILFSTLFIFVSYAFTGVFIRDLLHSSASRPVRILVITALLSLSLSSVGPFTLAYILASHSINTLLYRDSIYTYLHLQYNGFFSLSVFALLINYFFSSFDERAIKKVSRFATWLAISVFPTLCLSYLWHFNNAVIRSIAFTGCVTLVIMLFHFVKMMGASAKTFTVLHPFVRKIGLLSMIAFVLKSLIQTGIIFPEIGNKVFGDRPIIIGYLHLVMLGFVTLYLLTHLMHTGYFKISRGTIKPAVTLFTSAIILNEVVLMTQGLTAMIMLGSNTYPWLLWIAAILLFVGAVLIVVSALKQFSARREGSKVLSTITI
jgi:hypothetical protein